MIILPPALVTRTALVERKFERLQTQALAWTVSTDTTMTIDLSSTQLGDQVALRFTMRGANYDNFPKVTIDGNRSLLQHDSQAYAWVSRNNLHLTCQHEFLVTAAMAGNAAVTVDLDFRTVQNGIVLTTYLLRGYHSGNNILNWNTVANAIDTDWLEDGDTQIVTVSHTNATPEVSWLTGFDVGTTYELDSGAQAAQSGASVEATSTPSLELTTTGGGSNRAHMMTNHRPLTGKLDSMILLTAPNGAQGNVGLLDSSWRNYDASAAVAGAPSADYIGSYHAGGNGCIDFNGSSRIQLSSRMHPGLRQTHGWTLEWNENPRAAGGNRFGSNGDQILVGHTSGVLYINSAAGAWAIASGKSLGTILLNDWTHRAICWDGASNWYIWENGVLIENFTSSDEPHFISSSLTYMGWGASGGYFNGRIEDMAIHSYAKYTSAFTPPGALSPY